MYFSTLFSLFFVGIRCIIFSKIELWWNLNRLESCFLGVDEVEISFCVIPKEIEIPRGMVGKFWKKSLFREGKFWIYAVYICAKCEKYNEWFQSWKFQRKLILLPRFNLRVLWIEYCLLHHLLHFHLRTLMCMRIEIAFSIGIYCIWIIEILICMWTNPVKLSYIIFMNE